MFLNYICYNPASDIKVPLVIVASLKCAISTKVTYRQVFIFLYHSYGDNKQKALISKKIQTVCIKLINNKLWRMCVSSYSLFVSPEVRAT